MTKRTYICNLCGREHGKDSNAIVGFEWHGKDVIEKAPWAVENHICKTCLGAMVSLNISVATREKEEACAST